MSDESSHFRLFVESHQTERERILAHAAATREGKSGEVLVTDDRFVFIRNGFTGDIFKQKPIDRVRDVESKSGLFNSTLTVDGDDYQFSSNGNCEDIQNAVTDLMHGRVQRGTLKSGEGHGKPQRNSDEALDDGRDSEKADYSVSPYDRAWHDSRGLVIILFFIFFPVGVIGGMRRRREQNLNNSKFWHHTFWVWALAIFPVSAPIGLYAFYRRHEDTSPGAPETQYAGLILSGTITTVLVVGIILADRPRSSSELDATYASSYSEPSQEAEQEEGSIEKESGSEEPEDLNDSGTTLISTGDLGRFNNWKVAFKNPVASTLNGGTRANRGEVFLTVPYLIENLASSTRKDPMEALRLETDSETYVTRNVQGETSHRADIAPFQRVEQWQTFEIPEDAINETVSIAYPQEDGEPIFELVVYPSNIKER
jgi:hypothetical protein